MAKYHKYPSKKKLQKMLEHSSYADVARKLGLSASTFREHCYRYDIVKGDDRSVVEIKPGSDVAEIEMLRDRVRELESTHRVHRKQDVFDERVLQVLEGGVKTRKAKYSPRAIPKSHRASYKHEFALLWSDLHAGELVSGEEMNGINEYDWEIMLRRHDRIREGLFSYIENRPYAVEKLHVWALGDMLSGDIHEELSETNEVPLAEATVQLGLDMSVWLESLSKKFNSIVLSGVVGNHPRAHKKPRAKKTFDNADWTMYQTMKLALRAYPQINFDIPKSSAMPVMIAEHWRALLWHGDGVRSTMPGVPWGGVLRRVAALQNQYSSAGLPIDLFACGHFHTSNLVEGSAGKVAMNGSVKGPDEYSMKAFGHGRAPQQLLLTFHPRRGLTDASYLDLEDVVPAAKVLE